MSLKLNTALYHRALGAAHAGHVTHDEWSAPKDRTSDNSIAHDESQKGNAEEYAYPIFAEGGKLSDKGVGSALAYAKKNYASALIGPLEKISEAIRMHSSIAAAADAGGHWVTLDDGRHIFIGATAGIVPRRLQAEAGAGRFSKAHLERHLVAHHEAVAGKGTVSAADEQRLQKAAGAGDAFTFHKKLPTEIKQFMQGRPELRRMFKVTDNAANAGGADAFGDLGDRYLDIAEAKAGSPLRSAKETAHASNDPEVRLLAKIHDNLPEGRFSGDTISAKGLRVGDEFTIGGSKLRVAEDDQGMRVLEGGKDYPETPVESLTHLPVDKGSFKAGRRQKLEAAPFSADYSAAIFSLSTPEARPVLMLGTTSPKEIDGHPVYARRKEIARAGHYVHRGQKDVAGNWREFDIDGDRMKLWADAFHKRKAAGIRPFVPERHVESAADARANMGYVDDLQIEGDSLYATMHLIGEDALAAAARNDVSIYVIGDATDANGEKYDECIEHVCLTANPVIPNLQPFAQIAASADRPAISAPVYVLAVEKTPTAAPSRRSYRMKPEIAQQVRAKLGFGAEVPDDQLDDKAAEKALALSAEVPTLTGKVTSLTTERDALTVERDGLKTELGTAKTKAEEAANKVLQLSADGPTTSDPLAIALITRSFKTDRERVIESGVISEAGMKEVDALMFSDGKPTRSALALSAGGVDPFYSRLCDIIRRNPGLKTANGMPRGTTEAERLALAADPTNPAKEEDKVDLVALEQMRRYAHLPTPAAK